MRAWETSSRPWARVTARLSSRSPRTARSTLCLVRADYLGDFDEEEDDEKEKESDENDGNDGNDVMMSMA
jgi:hypothetical protein